MNNLSNHVVSKESDLVRNSMKNDTQFYIRIATREGYAYEPVELVIHKDKKPYGCQCYAYRTHDNVTHLIQCDQCGGESNLLQ